MPATPAHNVSRLSLAREAREREEERVRSQHAGSGRPEDVTDELLAAAREEEQRALAAVLDDVHEAVSAAGITGRYHALWEPAESRWRVTPLPDDDSEEPQRGHPREPLTHETH